MGEVLGDGKLAVNTRMLKHDAEAAPQGDGRGAQVVTEDADGAGLQRHQGGEQFEESGLAAAVGTEQPEDFAPLD